MKFSNVFLSFALFIVNVEHVWSLTCKEVLELPENKKLSLQDLQTIPPKDIVQCLGHLGKEPLDRQEAFFIWQTIVKEHGGVKNIPDKVLMVLHWVTPAVTPDDYANMTVQFGNIDVIANFGLNYHLDDEQLAGLAQRVREDFAGKEPEDYTYYDLTALRQILCAFNVSEIERIHPSAYRESALSIGKLENCNVDVLRAFATLAVQDSAFGDPNSWTSNIIETIGVVAKGLPKSIILKFRISTPKP